MCNNLRFEELHKGKVLSNDKVKCSAGWNALKVYLRKVTHAGPYKIIPLPHTDTKAKDETEKSPTPRKNP